jgi:uncharacterized protein YfbU (UPF0304 family)
LIKRCEVCGDFLQKYIDMLENKDKFKEDEELLEKIRFIINKRQDCINIYKKYDKCSKSCERHQYVVDVYKNILNE